MVLRRRVCFAELKPATPERQNGGIGDSRMELYRGLLSAGRCFQNPGSRSLQRALRWSTRAALWVSGCSFRNSAFLCLVVDVPLQLLARGPWVCSSITASAVPAAAPPGEGRVGVAPSDFPVLADRKVVDAGPRVADRN
eukprot:1491738-Alexandrium_andersonii.AAC.1